MTVPGLWCDFYNIPHVCCFFFAFSLAIFTGWICCILIVDFSSANKQSLSGGSESGDNPRLSVASTSGSISALAANGSAVPGSPSSLHRASSPGTSDSDVFSHSHRAVENQYEFS